MSNFFKSKTSLGVFLLGVGAAIAVVVAGNLLGMVWALALAVLTIAFLLSIIYWRLSIPLARILTLIRENSRELENLESKVLSLRNLETEQRASFRTIRADLQRMEYDNQRQKKMLVGIVTRLDME